MKAFLCHGPTPFILHYDGRLKKFPVVATRLDSEAAMQLKGCASRREKSNPDFMIGLAFLSLTVQNSYYGQEGYKMPAVRKVNATEMKQRLGQYLDYAMAGPVMVEKSGRSVVVLLSVEEYERLCAYEDAYWGQKALEAEKSGWASEEDVSALVERFNREEAGTK